MDIYFVFGVIPTLFTLLLKFYPLGAFSLGSYDILTPPFFFFFKNFPTFWYHKMFQAYVIYFMPYALYQLFLEGGLIPFIGDWY